MKLAVLENHRSGEEPDPPSARNALPPPSADPVWQRSTRYCDQPMRVGTRLVGIGGVGLVTLLILGGMLITWRSYGPPPASPTLNVFDVAPPAAPPEPQSEVPPGPEEVRKDPPPIRDQPMITPPEIQISSDNPVTLPMPQPLPDPGPPVKDTTAPESKPVPPAQQASNAKPTWEGAVLAALNKKKRYPRDASSRRLQGIPWIRFVIDREGKVLSVRLERSSGFRSLDDEAVDLPRRAEPLPKPPDDVPGQAIELVVPVEFFIR